MQERKRVLILGEVQQSGEKIREALTGTEWEIEHMFLAGQQLEEFSEQSFDVAVLELCSEENILLLQQIKKNTRNPVLGIVTKQGRELLKKALEQGMEDFVSSPLDSWEFLIRIEILRKRCKSMKSDVCRLKSFSLDKVRRKVYLKTSGTRESMIELSHTEYMLLSMFVENQNVLLTYKDLYKKVWDSDSLDDVRTVKVHVSNLRKKIDPQDIGIIANVRRAGYIFTDL